MFFDKLVKIETPKNVRRATPTFDEELYDNCHLVSHALDLRLSNFGFKMQPNLLN